MRADRLLLRTALDGITVLLPQEPPMNPAAYRQHYQPKPDRMPDWARRLLRWL
jgi:hypothetical protein